MAPSGNNRTGREEVKEKGSEKGKTSLRDLKGEEKDPEQSDSVWEGNGVVGFCM